MKIKTAKGIAMALMLAAICVLAGYHLSYPIELDRDTLPEHIKDYYNQGRRVEASPDIMLYDGVSIGKKAYYLVEIGEDLGSVTLEQGPTGQYKIMHLGSGGGNFLDGIIENELTNFSLSGSRQF